MLSVMLSLRIAPDALFRVAELFAGLRQISGEAIRRGRTAVLMGVSFMGLALLAASSARAQAPRAER